MFGITPTTNNVFTNNPLLNSDYMPQLSFSPFSLDNNSVLDPNNAFAKYLNTNSNFIPNTELSAMPFSTSSSANINPFGELANMISLGNLSEQDMLKWFGGTLVNPDGLQTTQMGILPAFGSLIQGGLGTYTAFQNLNLAKKQQKLSADAFNKNYAMKKRAYEDNYKANKATLGSL